MRRILILGSSGMLGTSLSQHLVIHGHQVTKQSRSESGSEIFEPNDIDAMCERLNTIRPDVIINLIAETNVDLCEKEPKRAYRTNVNTSLTTVSAARILKLRPHFIYVSSDQVYSGLGPHSEGAVNPINVYGMTKYWGELAYLQEKSTTLRTNFIGASRAKNRNSFSDWVIQSNKQSKQITVVKDVLFNPLHLSTICNVIMHIVEKKIEGVYNAGSKSGISKSDLAQNLIKRLDLDESLISVGKIEELLLFAKRPSDMRMNSSAIESAYSIRLPSIEEEIEKCVAEYI